MIRCIAPYHRYQITQELTLQLLPLQVKLVGESDGKGVTAWGYDATGASTFSGICPRQRRRRLFSLH